MFVFMVFMMDDVSDVDVTLHGDRGHTDYDIM